MSAPVNEDVKIEEVELDIPTVHPESPIAQSPIENQFDQEIEPKQETATLDQDLFKHEIHDEIVAMQE